MYSIQFTQEQLNTHVTGLDSSVRLIAQQIAQNQSSGAALKQLLPQLIKLDQEFDRLQETVSEHERMQAMLNKAKEQQKENEAKEKEKV